jgi:hypothetical protein
MFVFLFAWLITTIGLVISISKNVKLIEKLDRVAEQVEKSLDVIDTKYAKIAYIASTPVLSNEPQIKSLMSNVRDTKNAIIDIVNALVDSVNDEETKTESDVDE